MKVLLIDNYDSFTYNLAQAFEVQGAHVDVFRNDAITVEQARAMSPTHVVVSPGPGTPDSAGVSLAMIEAFLGRVPLLGVCLGHQSLVQVLGGDVIRAPAMMHGKSSPVRHDGRTLYEGLTQPFEAGRYHSLIAKRETIPGSLQITAETADGIVMGVRHLESTRKGILAEGVQFHPESVLTPEGDRLLGNFLRSGVGEASVGLWRGGTED